MESGSRFNFAFTLHRLWASVNTSEVALSVTFTELFFLLLTSWDSKTWKKKLFQRKVRNGISFKRQVHFSFLNQRPRSVIATRFERKLPYCRF